VYTIRYTNPPRTAANGEKHIFADLAYLQVVSEQPGTVANVVFLPYKEEVAGSNPASPTSKIPANSSVFVARQKDRDVLPGPFAATVLQPE
jgi:hypothetical protein